MAEFFKKHKRIIENIAYPLAALGIVFAVWAVAAKIKNKPLLLPSVATVFSKLAAIMSGTQFYTAVGNTLLSTLETFLLAFAFALFFSVLGKVFNPLHRLMSPVITILRAAPTMAIILLGTLWLDYDESPILVGFLIAFPLLYASSYSALSGVDEKILEMARVYGVSKADRVFSIYFPSVLPYILDSARSVVSLTAKVVIAAEVIAQTKQSIGVSMLRSNLSFDTASLIAWTIAAIVLSFVLEFAVSALKKLAGVKYGY